VASYCPEGVLVFQLFNQSGEVRVNKLNIGTDKIGPEEFLHNTSIIGEKKISAVERLFKRNRRNKRQNKSTGRVMPPQLIWKNRIPGTRLNIVDVSYR